MPMLRKRSGGATLLTFGNRGPTEFWRKSFTDGKDRMLLMDWRMTAPIIGPSIVPNPPMTHIIRGKKEFSAEKNEVST